MKPKHLLICAAVMLLTTAAAWADDLQYYSSDGPMQVHVTQDGRVSGGYQQDTGARRPGRLVGRVGGGGTLEGLWLQPESDHPCTHPREGTNSWGWFAISNAWSPAPYGVWGYCDEMPSRSWNLSRR